MSNLRNGRVDVSILGVKGHCPPSPGDGMGVCVGGWARVLLDTWVKLDTGRSMYGPRPLKSTR